MKVLSKNQFAITDAAGVRTLAYEQGRLKSESYAGGPFDGYVLERSYDGLQRYSGLTVGAINYQVSYGYDAASRLQTVWWGESAGAGVPSFSYAYHPHSSLVYTLKANNGTEDVLTTTKFWDKLNRLTSVSASSIGPDSELLYAYAHNDLNQRTQAVREDGRYWDYAYDDRGQVTLGQKKSSGGSVLAGFDFGYDYDFIGNRKSADSNQQTQVYQANALNQYTAISGHGTLAYDDDGNMTASGSGWAYEYDGENRLISAKSATTRLEHYYDSQSRRFATDVYGVAGVGNYQLLTTTYYLFDGWNLIHELRVVHGSPIATEKRYLWGLDVSGSLQGAGGVGGLLAMADEESGALAAYAYDGNGNVSRLYDLANGAVVGSYEYDPFGNTISQTGPFDTANPFRFSTKYLDESDLYYYGYRFYSASMGRWLNRDPIGEAGGVNVYGFVGNDGVNGWDLWGLARQQPFDWHHDYVQKYRKYFEKLGIDIDNKKNGMLFFQSDHLSFAEKYEEEWDSFWKSKNYDVNCTNKNEVEAFKNDLKNKIFAEEYKKSRAANINYKKWNKLKPSNKLEVGINNFKGYATALGVLAFIASDASAAINWANSNKRTEMMQEFANIMTYGDEMNRTLELITWYRSYVPSGGDPYGVVSSHFGAKATDGPSWTPEFAETFINSFKSNE